MSEEIKKKEPITIYTLINSDITQKFFPKNKKENNNSNEAKESLMVSKAQSNSSTNSNVSNASQSTATSNTSSSTHIKQEIQLKRFFEPNYKSTHVIKREPTEEEIFAAFKFYD